MFASFLRDSNEMVKSTRASYFHRTTSGRTQRSSCARTCSTRTSLRECIPLSGNTEGVISRQASGLSFDFPPGDGATYFAGTEDGLIHKCSVSYNEQYLETYHGHTGPVYRIRCSPFCERLFLSARYVGTVQMQHLLSWPW